MATLTVNQLDAYVKTSVVGVRRYAAAQNLFFQVTRKPEGKVSASWVFRWRFQGKDRSAGLGRYVVGGAKGQSVTLAEARKAAEALRIKIKTGSGDLSIERKAAANTAQADLMASQRRLEAEQRTAHALALSKERTVKAACVQWHEATAYDLSSDKYRAQRLRRLEDYFLHIGAVPVEALTVAQVSAAFEKLRAAMSSGPGGSTGAETLRRSSADLAKAFDWAAGKGWHDRTNVVERARGNLPEHTAVGRRFFALERLPDFWRAVADPGAVEGARYPVALQLLRLITLTAARTLEVRALQWSEVVDLDGPAPVLSIPAERMKRRDAWKVPLSPAAADVLREVRAWQLEAGAGLKGVNDGRVFVHLTGNYKGRCLSENAVNDLLQVMGWGDELTAHGLRKVFSTSVHGGWPYTGPNRVEAIEYSLSHNAGDKVRATYDKNEYMDLRRGLMDWWADQLGASIAVKAEPVALLRRVN